MANLETAKLNMIEQQIRPWNVLDRTILDAVMAESRQQFAPKSSRNLAFADMNLPIGFGQVMMQPNVEARLLQALQPKPGDLALEIGTGSGYLAAVLANLVRQVETVEIREPLAESAKDSLAQSGKHNVEVLIGDGARGWDAGFAPDCIVLSGSVPELPPSYCESMAIGGRLAAIVGSGSIMSAMLVKRIDETAWNNEFLFETWLPPLDNVPDDKSFEF